MGSCFDPMFHLAKALELEPHNQKAAFLHAKILVDKNEFSPAIKFIESYRQKCGADPVLNNLLAISYLGDGKIDKAEEIINQALCESPRSGEILHTAFLIKKRRGDKFSALNFLERIIRYDENTVEPYLEMAQLLDCKTELEKKISLLEISRSLNFENIKIFEDLLHSYLEWFKANPENKLTKKFINQLDAHTRDSFFLTIKPLLRDEVIETLKSSRK